ncbi:MAG: T9SS type A sorting domain-containing protein [Bacteroidota bacterium]
MKTIKYIFFVVILCSITISSQTRLANYVFGNGAVISSNSSHIVSGTIGQPIIGTTSNSSNINNIGFWYQYSETITDVNENEDLTPTKFELFQNYPNPFNPSTVIKYGLPKESNVRIVVYNILGEMVSTLVDNFQKAGYYEINFNASSLASGVYLYTIQSEALDGSKDYRSVKKMILLR